jgi:hypothetical protein
MRTSEAFIAAPKKQMIRRLLASAAILMAASGLQAADAEVGDGNDAPPESELIQFGLSADDFDSLMCLKHAEHDEIVKREFNTQLTSRIAQIAGSCHLRPVQKDQLLLAGRGDIKRCLDRLHELRSDFSVLSANGAPDIQSRDVQDLMRKKKELFEADPFGNRSHFAKALQRTLTPAQLSSVAGAAEIRRLGGAMAQTAANLGVTHVYLTGTPTDDGALAIVSGMSDLRFLALERTRVTDVGLAHLRRAAELDGLRLSDTAVSDEGVKHVGALPGLRMLWLSGTRVSDAGLAHLKSAANLEVLALDETQVTDAGMAHLQTLTNLRWLYLRGTCITDSGVRHFAELTRLQRLQLSDTNLTNLGLTHLSGLRGLEDLWLIGTRVTEVGMDDLRAAAPRLAIYK